MSSTLRLSARQRAALGYAAVGAWLVPWTAVLAATLPSTAIARHWRLAWCGLDVGEAVAATTTAWFLARHDRRASPAAAALATLLCVDAWFDVCTAPSGSALAIAIGEMILLELPRKETLMSTLSLGGTYRLGDDVVPRMG